MNLLKINVYSLNFLLDNCWFLVLNFFLFFLILIFFIYIYYYYFGFFFIFFNIVYFSIILGFLFLSLFLLNNKEIFINLDVEMNLFFIKIKLFQFYFNKNSLIFSCLVNIIFFFSFQFSYFYLNKEHNKSFFFLLLSIFSISMYIIFHANNIILLYCGWEIMGLSSFFLIGFYNYKISSFKSALKAFFFNKLSDFFFLTSCVIYYYINNTFTLIIKKDLNINTFYSFFFF